MKPRPSSIPPPPETELEKPTTSVKLEQSVHAILGNALNTPLPLVDPETGDLMKVIDKKRLEQFKTRYYDQYGKTVDEFVNLIKYFTGMSLYELEEVSTSKTADLPEIIDQTRKNILDFLSCNSKSKNTDSKYCFLKKYIPEERDRALRQVGKLADEYINEVTSKFFPGYEHDLSLRNEVSTCHDAAKLLFMVFDKSLDIRVRYEARRKLILMKILGEIEDYGEDDQDHENALNYMIGLLNERMIKLYPGEKTGTAFERFLISAHSNREETEDETESDKTKTDEENTGPSYKAIYAEIKAKPIKRRRDLLPKKDENAIQRITPMSMRRATVFDSNNNEREIFFYTIPREKDTFSRLTKILRHGKKVGEREDDRHGIRMVFEIKEDWTYFFELLKKNIKSDILKELEKRLEENPETSEEIKKRIENIDVEDIDKGGSVEIRDMEDNSDGLGGFKSNPKLKVLKFKLLIKKADENMQNFEFQIFFPDGFADYNYRRGVSWVEYQVRRFYKGKLDEMLFPSQIFPELDREDTRREAKRRAFDQIWDRDAIQFQEKKISKNHAIDAE